jgi:hypothetical protein
MKDKKQAESYGTIEEFSDGVKEVVLGAIVPLSRYFSRFFLAEKA